MERQGRGRRRTGYGVALAVGLGLALGAGWTVPPSREAGAQQSLVDSDPAVVRARAELEAAQSAAHEAEAKREATAEQHDAVVAKIADDEAQIVALEQQRAALAQLRDELRDHLRQRAVALYSMGGTAPTPPSSSRTTCSRVLAASSSATSPTAATTTTR